MNRLVQTKELKSNYWHKLSEEQVNPVFHYDEVLDTFFVYASPSEEERIITHNIDDDVAFLYRHSDKEIVGLKIEYFKKRFLPKYANRKWMLSETGVKLGGNGDFYIKAD